jgi:hypothetical protein
VQVSACRDRFREAVRSQTPLPDGFFDPFQKLVLALLEALLPDFHTSAPFYDVSAWFGGVSLLRGVREGRGGEGA